MAKKKKTIQLLPFDYLVKIGRIKSKDSEWIGNKKIDIPQEMENDWKQMEDKATIEHAWGRKGKVVQTIEHCWIIQNNWLKP